MAGFGAAVNTGATAPGDSVTVIGALLTVLSPFTLKASWSRLNAAGWSGFWSSSLMA